MNDLAQVRPSVVTNQSADKEHSANRIIIAIDLDAFYVAASRKRDPSLIGLPVAIKQKSICATTSYEARAKGVEKLMRIRDAVAKCPDLVFVDGEDLTYFRKISQDIFHLVSSMVKGGLVEKLGMDELFCDVTEMIEEQYKEIKGSIPDPFGNILPLRTKDAINQRKGYFNPTTQKLLLATHLARQIRERVAEEIGLTSSAGIATSKCLAKLVGNIHKPNQQTVLAPCDVRFIQQEIQDFLDPFPIRKLNGFGAVSTAKMCEAAVSNLELPETATSPEKMTILVARTLFDHSSMCKMFGERLADRLYGLLHGIDDEPVIRAPDFPAQISIEDSFFGLPMEDVSKQLLKLGDSLLKRLENELLDHSHDAEETTENGNLESSPESDMVEVPLDVFGNPVSNDRDAIIRIRRYGDLARPAAPSKPAKHRTSWLRYPLSLRLTTRQGYTNRISRQTRMPVEVFDVTVPRLDRARILMQSCETLFRAILKSEGNKGLGIHLINVAAIDLSINKPDQSIGDYFRHSKSEPRPSVVESVDQLPQIDPAFLLELPEEIRREVALEYGIELPFESEEEQQSQLSLLSNPQKVTLSQSSARSTMSTDSSLICLTCGNSMSTWLQHDHERWPEKGLPLGFLTRLDDDNDEEIEWDHEGEEEMDLGSDGE